MALALSRTWTVYTSAIPLLRNGTINVEGHSFKAVLLNGSYDPSAGVDSQRTDVAAYAIGTDQTVSPLTLSGDSVSTTSNVSWDGSYSPRYVAIYDDSSPSDYLLCVADMGGVQGPCSYRLAAQDLFSLSGISSSVESVVPNTATLSFTGYQPGIDNGSGVTPLFADSFETGNLSYTENSVSWGSTNDTSVQASNARTGSYALEFYFQGVPTGTDWSAEQRWSMPQTTEVWVEYHLKVPSNYVHRNEPDTEHHKLWAIWGYDYATSGRPKVVAEWWRTSDSVSYWRFLYNPSGSGTSIQVEAGTAATGTPANAWNMALGEYSQVRIHADMGTPDVANGVYQVWINGSLILDRDDLLMIDSVDPYQYFNAGYLMGYTNGGYTDDTYFYVDDFKIYTTDPGWA